MLGHHMPRERGSYASIPPPPGQDQQRSKYIYILTRSRAAGWHRMLGHHMPRERGSYASIPPPPGQD
ncbi:5'-3' exoribonuclease [Operophtera brumata]|uniref:5'-3' exoribonuclease n=1 Tax=Operophtera brumata TaxID=104452 RepID=A0A0L7KRG2_OPEBR|nr:5'-3' exoribonuclease [Operophtera brumata]